MDWITKCIKGGFYISKWVSSNWHWILHQNQNSFYSQHWFRPPILIDFLFWWRLHKWLFDRQAVLYQSFRRGKIKCQLIDVKMSKHHISTHTRGFKSQENKYSKDLCDISTSNSWCSMSTASPGGVTQGGKRRRGEMSIVLWVLC